MLGLIGQTPMQAREYWPLPTAQALHRPNLSVKSPRLEDAQFQKYMKGYVYGNLRPQVSRGPSVPVKMLNGPLDEEEHKMLCAISGSTGQIVVCSHLGELMYLL